MFADREIQQDEPISVTGNSKWVKPWSNVVGNLSSERKLFNSVLYNEHHIDEIK